MLVPALEWVSIQPLAYGDVVRFYRNWTTSTPKRWAALFEISLPTSQTWTAATVPMLPAGHPQPLEQAVCIASGLVEEETDEPFLDGADPGVQGMFSPPGEGITEAAEDEKCDLIHTLHHSYNYTYGEVYQLIIPELDKLLTGVERAKERTENERDPEPRAPIRGSRGGSHVDALF